MVVATTLLAGSMVAQAAPRWQNKVDYRYSYPNYETKSGVGFDSTQTLTVHANLQTKDKKFLNDAIKQLQNNTQYRFTYTPSEATAKIKISYKNLPGTQLGFAKNPILGFEYFKSCTMYIDDRIQQNQIPANKAKQTMYHELAHCLGLHHATSKNSIMYPIMYGVTTYDKATLWALNQISKTNRS